MIRRNDMYKVLIVEDSVFVKTALSNAISLMEECEIIDTIENAEMAEILCLRLKVDVIVMDICTKDDSSGLRSAANIKKLHPEIKIIISTSMPDYSFIKKAREAGCESFWYKNENTDELIDIIRKTLSGESIYPDASPVIRIGEITSDQLTPRELEVIKKLAEGRSYQEIADELYVSIDTVRQHTKTIYSKTGFHSNVQLISACIMSGLVLPGY